MLNQLFLNLFNCSNYFFKAFAVLGALVALSGLTDVLDGKIARKFNMISDLGKILDPIADKIKVLYEADKAELEKQLELLLSF